MTNGSIVALVAGATVVVGGIIYLANQNTNDAVADTPSFWDDPIGYVENSLTAPLSNAVGNIESTVLDVLLIVGGFLIVLALIVGYSPNAPTLIPHLA